MPITERDEDGFSLLEVLIAFVILSAALVAAHQSLNMSFRAFSAVEEARNAAMLAEEVLARYDVSRLSGAERQGIDQRGLRWTIRSTPVDLGSAFQEVSVESVVVDVISPAGKSVGHYATFRMAPAVSRNDR